MRHTFHAFDALFSSLILVGLMTFGYHGLQGEHGLFALMRLEAREETLAMDLAALRDRRASMENLVLRLSPSYLDLDLVDERARAVLGHMRADEVVPR